MDNILGSQLRKQKIIVWNCWEAFAVLSAVCCWQPLQSVFLKLKKNDLQYLWYKFLICWLYVINYAFI